jgi:hypothetical protein
MAGELDIIRSSVSEIDGCAVLTRLKAFVATQGVCATLEHVFRDRNGVPLDLSEYDGLLDGSESSEVSDSNELDGSIVLRAKEVVAAGSGNNPVVEVAGVFHNAPDGVVRAPVPPTTAKSAGVYQVSWAVKNSEGEVIAVNNALLSVERSLFSSDAGEVKFSGGPPTINEIRMSIMDSAPAENLLLDDVEFDDEQILLAITRPIRYWNEQPPPLKVVYDTRNFPFKEAWLKAIAGELMGFAAHNYRRNHLPYSAGGLSIDDKNKEGAYIQAAQMIKEEWRVFVAHKKIQLNAQDVMGTVGSPYGSGLF